jgi:hypothetical protein
MKFLLGMLQLMTFIILAMITVHSFMLQAYVAKQRKSAETSKPATNNRTDSWGDLNHVLIPDPLIQGIPRGASSPGGEHCAKTRIA